MTDIIIEYFNDTHARITTDTSIKRELSDYFSFLIENHFFNPKVKAGVWDGRIRLFGADGMLPLGLVEKCCEFAKEYDYTCVNKINLENNISKESFDAWLLKHPIYKDGTPVELHVEQYNSVYNILKASRLLCQMPTSSGKSAIVGLVSKYFFCSCEVE